MRKLALFTALLFGSACGHNKTPATTSPTQPATAAPAKAGDHDEKAEHANGKAHDKDDDDDDDDRAAKK